MILNTLHDKLFAWGIARAEYDLRELTKNKKEPLLRTLRGIVLEIGPGTGANLEFYNKNITWIGLEPSPAMNTYLKKKLKEEQLTKQKILIGTAEQIPLPARSVDHVVSTHVLCSVTNVKKTLQEIRRVLKKNGTFIFLEHVAAEQGTKLRYWQRRLRSVWKYLARGCTLDRELEQLIREAGFTDVKITRFSLNTTRLALVRPHIVGVARR